MKFIAPTIAVLAALLTLGLGHAPRALALEIIMTNEVAVGHWKTTEMNQFAETLAKRSNGRITAKVFPASQLYNDRDAVAALGTGAVHMVWPVTVNLETIDPRIGVATVPFVVTDELMAKPAAAAEFAQLLSSFVEVKNIRILAVLRTSDVFFLFRDRPIRQIADLRDQKIRVTGGRILQDLIRAYGANPISMAASEMAMALTTGAIDGIVTSAAGWSQIVGKSAKQASNIPGLTLLTYSVAVDKAWLEKLPAPDRAIVESAMAEFASTQWAAALKKDQEEIDAMVAQGGTYWRANAEQAEPFRRAAEPVVKSFSERFPDAIAAYRGIAARHAPK
jgi:TRAP-type C4-dicarboxylate transport system substrate-binding protein